MKTRIKDDNYALIQGWMRTKLDLKGTELIVFSVINGFSQAEDQKYSGTLQYLQDWTGASKQTVLNALQNLIKKGFIRKEERIVNNVKFIDYSIVIHNLEEVIHISTMKNDNNLTGGQKIRPGVVKKLDPINNIYKQDKDYIIYRNKREQAKTKLDQLNGMYEGTNYKKYIEVIEDSLFNSNMAKNPEQIYLYNNTGHTYGELLDAFINIDDYNLGKILTRMNFNDEIIDNKQLYFIASLFGEYDKGREQ